MNNSIWLFINCYFPTDDKDPDIPKQELIGCIGDLKNIILNNNHDKLFLFGDFNYDTKHDSAHVRAVSKLLEDINLESVWNHFQVDYTFSHQNEGQDPQQSIVDHFFIPVTYTNDVNSAYVCHDLMNNSDHKVILCNLKSISVTSDDTIVMHEVTSSGESTEETRNGVTECIDWNKVSKSDTKLYKENLDKILAHIPLTDVINCRDSKCSNCDHKADIDKFTDDIMEAMIDAGSHMPKIRKKNKNK